MRRLITFVQDRSGHDRLCSTVANRAILHYVVDQIADFGIRKVDIILAPDTGEQLWAGLEEANAWGFWWWGGSRRADGEHALEQIRRRQMPLEEVRRVLSHPEQAFEVRPGRWVLQSRWPTVHRSREVSSVCSWT
ncbi:MAG: hypothetical protein AB1609_17875 [Bacillota bacterium]